jgi:aspartyl-tRNA(Asn)/glutamyl-tRNA(Gln) amidotransferase subunit A
MLEAIASHDPADSTSANRPVLSYSASLTEDVKGLRLGIPKEYFVSGIQPEVERAVRNAIRELEKNGAVINEISLPHTDHAVAVYYIVATAEASSNLARYDGVKYGYAYQQGSGMWDNMRKTRGRGFGTEVKRRIMIGTYALSSGYYDAYYLKAQKVRTIIRREFDAAFQKYDVLVAPVTPTPAFRIGEKTADPYAMYLNDVFTLPVNIAGLPGISVPGGFVDGLPVGVQVIGKPFDESTVLRAAFAIEQGRSAEGPTPRPPL